MIRARRATPWVVAVLLLCGTGFCSLRYYNRYQLALRAGDSVWRLTYDVSFQAPKSGTRLEVAVPDDGPHARVIRQDLRYAGLSTERLRTSRSDTRELAVVTLRDGQFHLTARFDIHLTRQAAYRATDQSVTLSAQDRAHYLRNTRTIQAESPICQQVAQRLAAGASGKQQVLEKVFEYCQNGLASDAEGKSDAAGVVESGTGTPLGRARAMVALCRAAKLPARLASGFEIQERSPAEPRVWVEAMADARWEPFDLEDGFARQLPYNYLLARHDGADILRGAAVTNLEARYEVTALPPLEANLGRRSRDPLSILNLARLPLEMHDVLALLLLMPLGALVTSFFRTLVGIRTYGTFTPALLALAFVFADWRTGLVVFLITISLGLATRGMLDRLKLLMVPRLSLILTLVAVCIVFAVSLLDYLDLTPGPEAVLLPMVILTMTIERFYLTSEEDGTRFALQLLAGTVALAGICYGVLRWERVGRVLLVYPELHFFTGAALILMGRYTGYRLTELWRFREMKETP